MGVAVMPMKKITAKLSAIFPLCSGTAVSVWTSSAEAGSGSDLIVLSAVTGARHCTNLTRPELDRGSLTLQ